MKMQEFDMLGVCRTSINFNSDEDVYLNLIVSGFNLVNNHRKMLMEIQSNNATNVKLKEDNVKLEVDFEPISSRIL